MHRHRRIDTTATTTTGTAITKEKVPSVYCLCVPSEPPMAVSLSCRLLVKCCAAVCTHRVISLYLFQGTNSRSPNHKKLLLLVHTCAALSTCLFFVVMLCSPYSYSHTIDFCFVYFFSPLSSAKFGIFRNWPPVEFFSFVISLPVIIIVSMYAVLFIHNVDNRACILYL